MSKRREQRVKIRKLWDEDPKEIPLKRSKKRAVVLITVIFFCFAVILLRLLDLMILDHDKLSGRAEQQYIREKTLAPQRGVIWDRRMREMATSIEAQSLYAMPSKMEETRYLTRRLAPLVRVSSKKLNMKLLKKRSQMIF